MRAELVSQPVNKSAALYEPRRFLTALTRTCCWTQSMARCIQFKCYFISLRLVLIFCSVFVPWPFKCCFFCASFLLNISYVFLIIGLDLVFNYEMERAKYNEVSHVSKRGVITNNINTLLYFCSNLFTREHGALLGIFS